MTDNSNNVAPQLKHQRAKKRALSAIDEQQVRQWIAVVHRSEVALDRTSPAGRHIRFMDQGRVRYLRGLEFEEGIRRLNDGVIFEPLVDASRDRTCLSKADARAILVHVAVAELVKQFGEGRAAETLARIARRLRRDGSDHLRTMVLQLVDEATVMEA